MELDPRVTQTSSGFLYISLITEELEGFHKQWRDDEDGLLSEREPPSKNL